jgi:PadR family transcriptional regulator PadR
MLYTLALLGIVHGMANSFANWRTQIRKGYLELCILQLIANKKQLYGFDILAQLEAINLDVKEGTLYPLLNRMTEDHVLVSKWEVPDTNGRPRKYYSLTEDGGLLLDEMRREFKFMTITYAKLKNTGETHGRKPTDRQRTVEA